MRRVKKKRMNNTQVSKVRQKEGKKERKKNTNDEEDPKLGKQGRSCGVEQNIGFLACILIYTVYVYSTLRWNRAFVGRPV